MYDMMGSIILVEDEPIARDLAETYLTEKGYRVESFDSAEKAINRMVQGNAISLAILDVTLPGMNGIALAEWIRKNNPRVPVFFVTVDPRRITSPGVIALPKPVDRKDFLDHVWQHIKIGQTAANHSDLKSDFALVINKCDDLGVAIVELTDTLAAHVKTEQEAGMRRDDTIMSFSSRLETVHREATSASVSATSANGKVDAISVPNLLKGWRDKWDPALTAVISVLFGIICYLATEYKGQLFEKFVPAAKDAAQAKAEISQVRVEVSALKSDLRETKDSLQDIRIRQTFIDEGQVALSRNISQVMDTLNVPQLGRAHVHSLRASPRTTVASPLPTTPVGRP